MTSSASQPLALQDGNVHGPEDLLQKGHLLGQLLGHPMAGGLIAVVPQVAEGGALEVKGHADPIGALLLLHALQDVQEAKNGVGVQPSRVVRAGRRKTPG